jgi:hypothetical protein
VNRGLEKTDVGLRKFARKWIDNIRPKGDFVGRSLDGLVDGALRVKVKFFVRLDEECEASGILTHWNAHFFRELQVFQRQFELKLCNSVFLAFKAGFEEAENIGGQSCFGTADHLDNRFAEFSLAYHVTIQLEPRIIKSVGDAG